MKFYDQIERTKQTLWGAYIPQAVFYIAPVPIPPNQELYFVNRGGIVKQTPADFCIARHNKYPFSQVCCVVSGHGSLHIGEKNYGLKPGTLFLLPSYEAHLYQSDSDNPMGMVWLEFAGGDSDRLTKAILEKKGPLFYGSVYEEILSSCTEFLTKPPSSQNGKISAMLYQLLIAMYCEKDPVTSKKDKMVDEIYSYVDSRLQSTIRMADAADYFGYNPSYFSALFSEIFGISFTRYVLQCRIAKARYLLTSTDMSLEAIACALGFYDTSHFIQRFRDVEKISPSRFRRLNSPTDVEMHLETL